MPATAIIFTGGDDPGERAVRALPRERLVIAADSGLDHALRLGIPVDVAVGDFDSVDPDALARARSGGVEIEQHPADKDATDLALALDVALRAGVEDVVVIGGHGGRVDHWLGNVGTWASPDYRAMRVEVRSGTSRLFVVRDRLAFEGTPGEYVSLLAWNGPAEGVTTTGLRWGLDGDRLDAGSSRGVSNELVDHRSTVEIETGVVLVVVPGEHATTAGRAAEGVTGPG